MGVLEIIEKKYFLEDILDWIVNLKFQLSNISGCRDIADQEFTDQNLNCYILLFFMLNSLLILGYIKKVILVVKILSCHLEFVFFGPKIYQNSGSINPKTCLSFQKPCITGNIHLSTYQIQQIFWDISNNTAKTSIKVDYFFKGNPEISLVTANLTLATMQ